MYAKLMFIEPTLRVGTDCSGIEAPIQALIQLNRHGVSIPFRHVFSCEIDKYCQKSIRANYNPEILFDDITTRDISQVPDIDLYVCGFPCQPFSNAGKREGFNDKRGNIFWNCLEVIKVKQPKYFILENVKGLTWHDKGRTWKIIRKELESLENYNVYWKVLNTRHYGIPQNRERLYIVGILASENKQFSWPKHKQMDNILDYVDTTATHKDVIRDDVIKSGMLDNIPENSVFVDFSFKKHNYPNSDKYCPTIAADSRTWCVKMERYATPHERLRLQGFRNFIIAKNRHGVNVPIRQINKQAGNSMSVNILCELIKSLY